MRLTVIATEDGQVVRVPDGAIAIAINLSPEQALDLLYMREEGQMAFAAIQRALVLHQGPKGLKP